MMRGVVSTKKSEMDPVRDENFNWDGLTDIVVRCFSLYVRSYKPNTVQFGHCIVHPRKPSPCIYYQHLLPSVFISCDLTKASLVLFTKLW